MPLRSLNPISRCPTSLYLDLARTCCEMSRRDGTIVAWHEVPGKAVAQKNRPVGYGIRARPGPKRYFASKCAPRFLRKTNHSNPRIGAQTGANHTVPYGTVPLG